MSSIFSDSVVADGKKFDKTLIKVKRLGEGGFGHWNSMLHKDSGLIIVKKRLVEYIKIEGKRGTVIT